jgi:hypothetical protein
LQSDDDDQRDQDTDSPGAPVDWFALFVHGPFI